MEFIKKYFLSPSNDFIQFIRRNPLLLLASFTSYLITTFFFGNFIFFLVTYIICIALGFSPAGEWLLRAVEGARKVETNREKEYILPLFDEVIEDARAVYPDKLKHVKPNIIDSMTIYVKAIGRDTIAISKGAIETLTEDELRALIAHELSHIINYDTLAYLFAIVGSGLFAIIGMLARFIMATLTVIQYTRKKVSLATVLLGIVWFFLEAIVYMISFVLQITIAKNCKNQELHADMFAKKIGYGDDLIETLYLLQKISLGEDKDISTRMLANHPRISLRIEKLENEEENAVIDGANFNP